MTRQLCDPTNVALQSFWPEKVQINDGSRVLFYITSKSLESSELNRNNIAYKY